MRLAAVNPRIDFNFDSLLAAEVNILSLVLATLSVLFNVVMPVSYFSVLHMCFHINTVFLSCGVAIYG